MRALIQRVSRAQVSISGKIKGEIGGGLLIFLGIEAADTDEDILWLVRKITQLRIFNDAEGVMNLSLLDVGGEALVISQFTLHASTKKGNRPSYIRAARPEIAIPRYEAFLKAFTTALGKQVASGTFGADMQVELLNDGPVTLWIDSKNRE